MLGYLLGFNAYPQATSRLNQDPIKDVYPDHQIVELTRKVESLEMACAGLWELLKKTNGLTDDQLMAAIHEVDARDGTVDGRITPTVGKCPHCGRQLLTRARNRCAWCGAELSSQLFGSSPQ